MTKNQAFQVILDILRSTSDLRCKVSIEKLNLDNHFQNDLGFDSLAMAAFFYELQDRYPTLTEESASHWRTLGDCADTMAKI